MAGALRHIRHVACAFVAGILCVATAHGQSARDEGFPAKPASSEAFPDASVDEACVAVLFPGEFEERCAEGNEAATPDPFGGQAGASPFEAADPLWNAPPRLECPSAVFLEELETASIDCRTWDAAAQEASEEAIDFAWERVGGATWDYMEHPRLTPQDVPNPLLVAPSSPFYDTLESFLAEETTKKYRYRLRATSRATGLSSFAEVDVFVLLNRPSVHCPLEVQVEEGGTVALSCEGADPLSFRMDEEAGSSALWEWEGLWGASMSALSATDLPAPFFRAPLGSAGQNYHYVASMTTTSSGVPRTARRKVSVTVVEGENAGLESVAGLDTAHNPPPTVECTDAVVYPTAPNFRLHCEVTNEPAGAAYSWDGTQDHMNKLSIPNPATPTPMFSTGSYKRAYAIDAEFIHEYTLTLSAPGITDVKEKVTVTVRLNPDLMQCNEYDYVVYTGDPDFNLDCEPKDPSRGNINWHWQVGPKSHGKTDFDMRVPRTWILNKSWRKWNPPFSVPESLPAGVDTDYYQFRLHLFHYKQPSGYPGLKNYNLMQVRDITVTVIQKPKITVQCADPPPVYEGHDQGISLSCSASGAPAGSASSYDWQGASMNLLAVDATDSTKATFAVPASVDADKTYEYTLTVSAANAEDGEATATVTVMNKPPVVVTCEDPEPAYEGHAEDLELSCSASGAPGANPSYSYDWQGASLDLLTVDATDSTKATFAVPASVDADKTYEYTLTASAANAEDGAAKVTVAVLEKPDISIACSYPKRVREGAKDFPLDCEATGAPEGASYDYFWYGWDSSADTKRLSATDIASPTFDVPASVPKTTTYKYRLTAASPKADPATEDVVVTVLKTGVLSVSCPDNPYSAYEGSGEITLECSGSGAPDGSEYAYSWEALGAPSDLDMLSVADISSPTFAVKDAVDKDEKYEYRLTASAENSKPASVDVTVTVLRKESLAVTCPGNPYSRYEGSEDITLDCSATGAPDGSEYAYSWEALGAPSDLDMLSDADGPTPTFLVPDAVGQNKTYEYKLTVSADNAEPVSADVDVTVLKMGTIAVSCPGNPYSAYEGAEGVTLDCSATGAPSDASYAWTALDASADLSLLVAGTDGPTPTFAVPNEANVEETYRYRLTVTAENMQDGVADVTVTVMPKESLAVTCPGNPYSRYEGSEDITLDCSATGAPEGSEYSYVWEARDATSDTDRLSATDISSPAFAVPDEVDRDETYEYRLTVSAENSEPATAEVTVTVLNKPAIVMSCPGNPYSAYEGSGDLALDCSATGAPEGSSYAYAWKARGATENTDLLSETDISSPTFAVPDEVDADETYEYRLTVSAENAEPASAEITITVLNKGALAVSCPGNPYLAYEGAEDITLNCSATGAPEGSSYDYAWEARGPTADTDRLSAPDISSPTFAVPASVDADETYEYRLTVSAENAESATADVTVTVLNKPAIVVSCPGNPYSAYEGAEDVTLDCSATGAPEGSSYAYVWEARGATADTDRLSETDISSPTFAVPASVDADETYEYRLTVSSENAEPASADVTVTVLDEPAVVVAQQALSDLAGLGLAVEASLLRFGTQAANTQVALDPLTDRITNSLSGLYHAGRMTLAPSDAEAEAAFSIELLSPATLRLVGDDEAPPLALEPAWSYAASCEQKASAAIRGLSMEATLSEADDCRLLLFGGSLDLADARPGRYQGTINVVVRSGAAEETHSVPVEARVAFASRMITIGPGGARIDAAQETPAALTQEQNLSVYPDLAFLTDEVSSGAFTLSNPSLVPLEISVSARFGYAEATEDGREAVVEDQAASRLGDLSEWVDVYPQTMVLEPGEEGVVRYAMKASARSKLTEAGYAAFFEITSSPRQYVRGDQMPEDESGDRTARVTLRAPAAYAPGQNPARLTAELFSLSQGASPSATFLVETEGRPFAGEMVAYDSGGEELGRGRALVYTRSRVRMTLARTPEAGEAALLRFVPLHSDHAPEPVAIRWDAPGRDLREIGAAMDRDGAPSLGVAPAPAGRP